MYKPLSLFIGIRYITCKHRGQLISLIAFIALLGMALGIFSLIVVTSVMNGFEATLRERVLSTIPHASIDGPDKQLHDWQTLAQSIQTSDAVQGVAPYISRTALLNHRNTTRSVTLTAIDPDYETQVSHLQPLMVSGQLNNLQPQRYGIVLNERLAQSMGLMMGDTITLTLPQVTVTPLGLFPRRKTFTVVGLFNTDSISAHPTVFIHLNDGQTLLQMGEAVQGLSVELNDALQVDMFLASVANNIDGLQTTTWHATQGSLFAALKMEKMITALLLLMIVIIAIFNIVAILTMTVTHKQADIAILRTMGAKPRSITALFMLQGITIGVLGIALGVGLGIPSALYIGTIVDWFERQWGTTLFNHGMDLGMGLFGGLPSVVKWQDIAWIISCTLLLSALATWYPAKRAAQIQPAKVLH